MWNQILPRALRLLNILKDLCPGPQYLIGNGLNLNTLLDHLGYWPKPFLRKESLKVVIWTCHCYISDWTG